MTISASKALQYESEFLSGVGANLEAAKGTLLRGSTWQQSQHDDGDRLRVLMAESGNYDRELLKSIPSNRRVAVHGYQRRMVFWKFKSCPRCGGDVFLDSDHRNWYEQCVQCGYMRDLESVKNFEEVIGESWKKQASVAGKRKRRK